MKEYFIGIDVGGTNIKIMIMDKNKMVLDKSSIKTERQLGYEEISDNIIHTIEALFEKHKVNNKKILAIAMGLPGIVDSSNNRTIILPILRWDGFNPCKKLGDYFDAPTIIDNDANVHTWGEFNFGEGLGISHMVLLTLGTGVGGGIIMNKEILRGTNNLAAEIGHMTIVSDGGDICMCGRRGCMEAYCSGTALARDARMMMESHPGTILHQYLEDNHGVYDNSMITKGVLIGDEIAVEIMNRFIRYLSIGIANLMKLFNPELVLIGGGISNAGDLLIKPVNEQCQKLVLNESQYCPVKRAKLGSESGMYGACAMAAKLVINEW
jgi:glucokinase